MTAVGYFFSALADFVRERVFWAIISFSLFAGLIAAYGRERHVGRRPDGNWWVNRFCLMPFLIIAAAWATDQFTLSSQQAALVASLLSLMGYEAVRIVVDHIEKRSAKMVDAAIDVFATPKPYASLVDSDAVGRPTAHVIVTPDDDTPAAIAGVALHGAFDAPTVEPIPPVVADLLTQLDMTGGSGVPGDA